MTEFKVSYAPPTGKPLGTNLAFKIGTSMVIPLLNLVGKKQWRGGENIPPTGPAIVASNHISYLDVLFLTHFLYRNGRAPRYIGKEGVFKTPIIGKIVLALEDAEKVLGGVRVLVAVHILADGVYSRAV